MYDREVVVLHDCRRVLASTQPLTCLTHHIPHKLTVAHNYCLLMGSGGEGEKITQVHLKHPPSNCRFIHDYAKLFRMEISHVKLRS